MKEYNVEKSMWSYTRKFVCFLFLDYVTVGGWWKILNWMVASIQQFEYSSEPFCIPFYLLRNIWYSVFKFYLFRIPFTYSEMTTKFAVEYAAPCFAFQGLVSILNPVPDHAERIFRSFPLPSNKW
jgi:hypothetical protein